MEIVGGYFQWFLMINSINTLKCALMIWQVLLIKRCQSVVYSEEIFFFKSTLCEKLLDDIDSERIRVIYFVYLLFLWFVLSFILWHWDQ